MPTPMNYDHKSRAVLEAIVTESFEKLSNHLDDEDIETLNELCEATEALERKKVQNAQ